MTHPNAERVAAAAAARGLDVEVREFPDGTRTADDAAAAIGVEVGQIVKSLIFAVDDEVVLVLMSGKNQLDEAKLAQSAGGRTVGKVGADQVRFATGFPIGGVPPVGHSAVIRSFFDQDLLGYDVVWAAAGTPRHVFSAAPHPLAEAAGALVAELAAD